MLNLLSIADDHLNTFMSFLCRSCLYWLLIGAPTYDNRWSIDLFFFLLPCRMTFRSRQRGIPPAAVIILFLSFVFFFVCLFLLLVVAYTRWCTCVYIAHIVSVVCVMAELFIWCLIAGRQTWRGRDATVEPAVDDAQVRLASRSWAFGGDKLRSQRTWSWDAQDDPRRQLLDSQRTFRSLA